MTDRSAAPRDKTSEQHGQKGLNVVAAGLDPCNQSFNDAYRDMLKTQLGKITGQQLTDELLDAVEDRLHKNGFKVEDIAGDPENHQSALKQAFIQGKDGLEEKARLEQEG